MTKFCDEKIKEFLEELGSDMPAPGGGAVAGLTSAISGALNSMVYSLTVGKKAYLALDEKEQLMVREVEEKSKKFTDRSLDLMEADRENFMKLMDSYKLPKESEEDKKNRAKAIKDNTIKAMEAPLVLARESLSFYDNLDVMAKYGNKMLLSDLSIAAILLHCAIESSVVNVKVNLNSLRNEEFFEEIDKEIKSIMETSEKKKNEIYNYVDSIIYK